jgi:hypothetical protein
MLPPPIAPACAVALLAAPLAAAAQPSAPTPIVDVMLMTVCTDSRDSVVLGLAPTDAACTGARKLRPGETPPYRLFDFSAAGGACAGAAGVVSRVNQPVALAGVTRVVSFDRHVPRSGCQPSGAGSPFGASVQGSDGQYGFIMGDDGPTGLISYDSTTQCRATPHSTTRFARGWVIGPATPPAPLVPGYTAINAVLTTGVPATALQAACPTGGALALTDWVLDAMTFTGGLKLSALVSDHYSNGNAAGTGPGTAQQMERTYWTKAFGLTRWEKWARSDWTGGTAPVATLASTLKAGGTCNAPHAMPAAPAPAMQVGALQSAGGWSQAIRDATTGAQYTWMMVDCDDYTNLDRNPPPDAPSVSASDDGWWQG